MKFPRIISFSADSFVMVMAGDKNFVTLVQAFMQFNDDEREDIATEYSFAK